MVTLMATGRMSLNKIAGKRLEENAIEHVLLLWDKDVRRVGIKPITKKDTRAYKLSYSSTHNAAGFSAVTFFRFINYDWDKTRSYQIEWNEDENMYVFSIPAEHLSGSARMKRNPNWKPKSNQASLKLTAKSKEHKAAHLTQ
ncbi:MAG: hypothetical protein WB562_18325 [Candidatus Sulfotelmatobacter sp.]